jgi:peptidoglycan/xylan/chitin deacetylase (PgdA/CDA1 family)
MRNPLRFAVRRIRNRLASKALILTYHHIGEAQSDPWGLFVSPNHFRQHLQVLRRYGPVLPLQELVQALKAGKLPRRSIALTFDDGYRDWYEKAKPSLQHFGIPTTMFLVTGMMGASLWWDDLSNLLLHEDPLPETLQLIVNGRSYSWSLGSSAHLSGTNRLSSWKATEVPPTERHAIYFELWQLLRPAAEGERRQVLEGLRTWAGRDASNDRDRLLTAEEVVESAKSGLVEIGAHTVTHPLITALPPALRREEIQNSKTALEKVLGRPVVSFAFPYGNCDPGAISIVREAGFTSACITKMHCVRTDTDCYELSRIQVGDWDGVTFDKQVSKYFSLDD